MMASTEVQELVTRLEENIKLFNWHEKQMIRDARAAVDAHDPIADHEVQELRELAERT